MNIIFSNPLLLATKTITLNH